MRNGICSFVPCEKSNIFRRNARLFSFLNVVKKWVEAAKSMLAAEPPAGRNAGLRVLRTGDFCSGTRGWEEEFFGLKGLFQKKIWENTLFFLSEQLGYGSF